MRYKVWLIDERTYTLEVEAEGAEDAERRAIAQLLGRGKATEVARVQRLRALQELKLADKVGG